MYLDPWLIKRLHDGLVAEYGVMKALCLTVTLRFDRKHEELARVMADEPTVMGVGGFTGMRMNRVMVVRLKGRRREFAKVVGEEVEDGDGDINAVGDVDAEGESE